MTRIISIALPICNVFLVQGEKTILVDTGRPQDAPAILQAMRLANVSPADLSLILHTHGHWDHCGSTLELKKTISAPTAIHALDAPMMRQGNNGFLKPTGWIPWMMKPWLDRPFPGLNPDIILEGETDLRPFGIDARVIPTPGHTAGSISLLTSQGEAIVGDLIMGGYLGGKLWPHIPTLHYFAEDLGQLRTSVHKLLDLGAQQFFTGHGGPLPARGILRNLGWDV